MLPPAMFTGTFALTAFCLLTASEPAHCDVLASWTPAWKPPAPPQPALQDEPPTFWVWSCFWVVSASLDAFASASEFASWLAELGPAVTLPPAMFTGVLALTAFCLLIAAAPAVWSVEADWTPACKAPGPPPPPPVSATAGAVAQAKASTTTATASSLDFIDLSRVVGSVRHALLAQRVASRLSQAQPGLHGRTAPRLSIRRFDQ